MAKDIGDCLGAKAERHHEIIALIALPLATGRDIHRQNQMTEVGRKRPVHQLVGEVAVHHIKLEPQIAIRRLGDLFDGIVRGRRQGEGDAQSGSSPGKQNITVASIEAVEAGRRDDDGGHG